MYSSGIGILDIITKFSQEFSPSLEIRSNFIVTCYNTSE